MIAILFILAISYPIESWQNEVLEERQVRGEHFSRFPSVRPYDLKTEQIFNDHDPLSGAETAPTELWLANSSFDLRYDTLKVLRFKPRLFADWSDFSFILQPVIKFGRDSLPPIRIFAGLFAADNERASAKYSTANFEVFIGRERFALGPSPRYNLILSGYGAPMDWFHYALRSKVFQLSYYLSQLDDMTCKPVEYVGDTITDLIEARRFLVIKRLDVSPADWLNFSFSEAATFGGENYALAPYHFNPVVLLHTYQHNWGKPANLFFNLDAKIFFKNIAVYGSLLVDDYQLEPDRNGEPNHLGLNIGAEFCDLLVKKSFVRFEYTRMSRWIYAIFTPYQRYEYAGAPIGYPFGPGSDEIYGKWVYHLQPGKIDLTASIAYLRKGESEVNSLWPIPEEPRIPGTVFPDNNFLSGVIQKTLDSYAGARFFHKPYYAIDLSIGFARAANHRHQGGVVNYCPMIRCQFELLDLFHR
jgi:hypothetical protein